MFAGSTEHGAWSKEVMSVQDVQIKRYQCTLGVLVVSGWARAHPLNSITQTERVSTCLDVLRKAPTDSHQLRASQKIELTVGRSDRKRAQWRSLSAQKPERRGSPLRRRLCLLLEGATGRGREAGFCLGPDRGKISPFLVNGRYKLVWVDLPSA